MATIQASDIRIYANGAWHSLQGQRIYANGAWRNFKNGSSIAKNGNWYTLQNPAPPLTDNIISLSANKDGGVQWTVQATAQYAVTSNINITGQCSDDFSGAEIPFSIFIAKGQISGVVIINTPTPFSEMVAISEVSCSPNQDDTYNYIV